MRLLSVCLLCLVGFAWSAHAAPLVRDLGDDLTYLRIAKLPEDLPTTNLMRPCVLDLRYAKGGESAALGLRMKLKASVGRNGPILVLCNAETDLALRHEFAGWRGLTGVLTLGSVSKEYAPDISIRTDPDVERHAYDALPVTSDIATLLSIVSAKVRYDEASITEARSHGQELEDEPPPELTDSADAEKNPGPLIDQTLLRATQIYHAWRILKTPPR